MKGLNSGAQDLASRKPSPHPFISADPFRKLALVEKGAASASLLSTYHEEHLPVIAVMLEKSTELLKSMVNPDSTEAGWKRGGDLRQLGTIAVARSSLTSAHRNRKAARTSISMAMGPMARSGQATVRLRRLALSQ